MNKVVIQRGFCPVQQCNYQVSIDYIETSSLTKTNYSKGLGDCMYIRNGGSCDIDCPIMESAPQNI